MEIGCCAVKRKAHIHYTVRNTHHLICKAAMTILHFVSHSTSLPLLYCVSLRSWLVSEQTHCVSDSRVVMPHSMRYLLAPLEYRLRLVEQRLSQMSLPTLRYCRKKCMMPHFTSYTLFLSAMIELFSLLVVKIEMMVAIDQL